MDDKLSSTCVLGASSWAAGQERLARILDEYLQGLERGEPVTPESLLAAHPDVADELRGYLSGLKLLHQAIAPPHEAAAAESGSRDDRPVRRLGDFRLVREIGRGGMGIVYEGVQISLDRRVALKVLPFAAAIDEKQITRFKNEAQAAAQVDHPHIVPVFAVGQEHGIHYFAMQLIGGQSLSHLLEELRDESKDGLRSTNPTQSSRRSRTRDHVKAVARMGVQAAEALQAAHEIGVIHRDVKPSNLLLDEKGKLWVTDFGVARCRTSVNLTETGYALGTIRYMSPEQAMGRTELVDHRTDIYSLGVTLYELAALRHPFEGIADAALAFKSGRAGWRRPRYWNASIPIDFENIVLKAMSEGRDERYATAGELAEDLRRFLEDRPILARRPPLTAYLGKWARRHKRSVAAAAGMLLLAVSGLVASLVVIAAERSEKDQAYRAAEASHGRAEKKFRQAREMLDRFGSRVAERLTSVPGTEGVRRELLNEMLPYYREFAREAADEPDLQADLALTHSKIGYLLDQLGPQAEAEQAYREARAILEELARRQPSQAEPWRNLALCSNNLGQLLARRGAVDEAREQLERALRIQQWLVDRAGASSVYLTDLATTQSNLGLLASRTGDRQQAAQRYRAAIEIQESIRRTDPQDATNRNNLAASYNNLGALYLDAQPGVAQRWIESAMFLQLGLVRDHPQERGYQSDLALSYNNLGAIHARQSSWTDAGNCYQDAIALQQRLVTAAPLVAAYRRDLSVSYNNLGMMQSDAGALAEAKASFASALEIQQQLVDEHPHDVTLLSGLGGISNNLGMAHQKSAEWAEACAAFERAIAAQQQAHRRAPEAAYIRESLSKHYYNYAQVLRALDRPADAAAAAVARRRLWPEHATRLLNIAEELAVLCKQLEPGEIRQRYLDETRSTLQAARSAGLAADPDLSARAFDVLSSLQP